MNTLIYILCFVLLIIVLFWILSKMYCNENFSPQIGNAGATHYSRPTPVFSQSPLVKNSVPDLPECNFDEYAYFKQSPFIGTKYEYMVKPYSYRQGYANCYNACIKSNPTKRLGQAAILCGQACDNKFSNFVRMKVTKEQMEDKNSAFYLEPNNIACCEKQCMNIITDYLENEGYSKELIASKNFVELCDFIPKCIHNKYMACVGKCDCEKSVIDKCGEDCNSTNPTDYFNCVSQCQISNSNKCGENGGWSTSY